MGKLLRASVAAIVLSTNTAAMAQQSVQEAQATVNRVLEGAEFGLMFDTGRTLDAYGRISGVRSVGRCKTAYSFDYPDIEAIPEHYRGLHNDDNDIDWTKDLSDAQAEGSKVYYNAVGNISGKMRRFHYRFGSSGQAAQFAAAASTLIDACRSGDDDNGPVDEQVIDARGNVASLAIDRHDGSRYGWAVDYETREAADSRALAECGRDGSSCHIVLRFTGGCGAYAADTAKGSTVYGWGTATSRGAAESRAHGEASKRGGTSVITRVWGWNSVKPGGASAAQASAAAAQEARAERERQFQEALRKHDEEVKAHEAAMEQYRQQLDANKTALEKAAARGEAATLDYEAQLAKAKAAQEQYERDQQAYREEYKRLTGHYPEGN